MSTKTYRVFVRNWWKQGAHGLVPDSTADKLVIAEGVNEMQAKRICFVYNGNTNPGPLSRKAEYEEE